MLEAEETCRKTQGAGSFYGSLLPPFPLLPYCHAQNILIRTQLCNSNLTPVLAFLLPIYIIDSSWFQNDFHLCCILLKTMPPRAATF